MEQNGSDNNFRTYLIVQFCEFWATDPDRDVIEAVGAFLAPYHLTAGEELEDIRWVLLQRAKTMAKAAHRRDHRRKNPTHKKQRQIADQIGKAKESPFQRMKRLFDEADKGSG
jgi:hypothetical protein